MNNIQPKKHLWHLQELLGALSDDPVGLIDRACSVYTLGVEHIARQIADDPNHKIIMLAGPSGSGKTTTANVLRQALKQHKIDSAVVSLDDFYLGQRRAPMLKNGEPDYESVYALNIPLLKQCLQDLCQRNECLLPKFDFPNSKPFDKKVPLKLNKGDLIIFEGIHALNPLILDHLPTEHITKIYVSVETTVFNSSDVLISPREIRLARRLVRDSIFRGADALKTLTMWTGVIEGEDKYLLPYKNSVDYTISTFHEFEPSVLKPYLLPLLEGLPFDAPNYALAMDLKADYGLFPALNRELLGDDCLIHEFIG